jgi:hypothetical protein
MRAGTKTGTILSITGRLGGITDTTRIAAGIFPGLLAGCLLSLSAVAADGPRRVNFNTEPASAEAKHVADWVVHAGDNRADDRKVPFVILDKADARIYLFDAEGKLRAAAPALLGLGKGDTSFEGIGDRALSTIRPNDRTTPAGRFVGFMGHAFVTNPKRAEDVLWVDYPGGVSIHRVVKTVDRLRRMATPTPLDNRISFGCINVPVKFFEDAVRPAFKETKGIVYVLPETKTAREVFASYDVEERMRLEAAKPVMPALNQAEEPKQR